MFLHAHMLSPFNFAADMMRDSNLTSRLLSVEYRFPFSQLEKMGRRLVSGSSSEKSGSLDAPGTEEDLYHKEAAGRSNAIYPIAPYDLPGVFDHYPGFGDPMPPITFPCPRCSTTGSFAAAEWIDMRLGNGKIKCRRCVKSRRKRAIQNTQFSKDTKQFSEDSSDRAAVILKGAVVDPVTGEDRSEIVTQRLRKVEVLTRRPRWWVPTKKINFDTDWGWAGYKGNFAEKEIITEFQPRFKRAYEPNIWPALSMCLISAVQRQVKFVDKIISCQLNEEALQQSVRRYGQFMGLMKETRVVRDGRVEGGELLVPTLDIDLSWHTHQLFPGNYRDWCLKHVGCIVNHNDTIAEAGLASGLGRTSTLWRKKYGDEYTTCNGKPRLITSGRASLGCFEINRKRQPPGSIIPALSPFRIIN